MKAGYVFIAAMALATTSCMTFELRENHFFVGGPAEHPQPIEAPGATAQALTIPTPDGVSLAAAYVTTPAAKADLLYFGGNVSRIDDFAGMVAEEVTRAGLNLFAADYRGYGRSTGEPQIESLKKDAVLLFDYVRAHNDGRPIVVHGFSMGSFIAAYLATQRPVSGLVLESTATNVEEWARANVPAYAKPFVRVHIAPVLKQQSNKEALTRYTGPLLLLTGSKDPVTPPKFALDLLQLSPSTNKRAVIVKGATHGDVMVFDEAKKAYVEFVKSL